jgi:hypothetical protein
MSGIDLYYDFVRLLNKVLFLDLIAKQEKFNG